jgi:hypothetical protein
MMSATATAELLFDDPLTNSSTIGIRNNGQGSFVSGVGWKVTSYSDNIRYTPANPIEHGALEFEVKGLINSDNNNPDGQLMSMYDASWGSPRTVYAPDLRLNPFKMVWHRYGDDGDQYHEDEFKLIMNVDGINQFEDYSGHGPYNWVLSTWYHFRIEWCDGRIRFYRDGVDSDRWPFVYRGIYDPPIHDIRIGTNTRNNAIKDAIYRNVKIYDYKEVPVAPYIGNPTDSATVKTTNPVIDWVAERHDMYEMHITTGIEPEANIVRDSGQVTSALNYHHVINALSNSTTYYAHARVHNYKGWGPWSGPVQFTVNTSGTIYVPCYGEYEVVLLADTDYANPYTGVTLSATFDGPGSNDITVNGFWDGGRNYKIRMMPTVTGTWTYATSSNKTSLNNKTGGFTCQSSSNKGYIRPDGTYKYTFEWVGDGSPFFLLGDTIWHMYYNLRFGDGTFQQLIDDRAAQHFNYAHGVLGDYLHNEGGSLFSKMDTVDEQFDCDWIDPGYYQWVDKKIDYMNSKGMCASLFFSWGNEGYQEFDDSNQYDRYIRYIVARYGSKNVYWVIVGEFDEAGETKSTWQSYHDEVANADAYDHPITMHPLHSTGSGYGTYSNHTAISQQESGTPEYLRSEIASDRQHNKPVVNLEYGYEGDPAVFPSNQPASDVRKDHYAIVLAGGYGVYGNHTPWYTTYHRVADFVLEATDTEGAEYMKILYEFFEDTSFERLSPSQSLVNTGICAAWTDNEYVVQLLAGGTVNLNLSAASGTFYVDWWDPITGTRMGDTPTTGGAARNLTAPNTSQDWILHVHKSVIDPGAPTAVISTTPSPASGNAPLAVSFDASSSSDSDGNIVSYEWDFEDDGSIDATGVTANHTYGRVGNQICRLTVTDNDSKTGQTAATITVTSSVSVETVNVLPAGTITIDGSTSDWALTDFDLTSRAGMDELEDISLTGYENNTLYYSGYSTNNTFPTNASDHTSRVYMRHDSTYLYFLIRLDDSDVQTDEGTQGDNWKNDCVELYIDPSHNGGSTAMSNSTSDIQLVIDAANRQNVYMTTSGYKTQILNGLSSSVSTDGTGWWLEGRLTKSALDPDISNTGTFGIDFNYRDNDNSNDTTKTTIYTWADTEQSGGFPSKIPNRWGDATLADLTATAPDPAYNPNPVHLSTGVDVDADISWTGGAGVTSHDVYFGTDSTPDAGEFKGNQAGITYNPGTLSYSTTYYWRIDEVNAVGTTTGSVWNYTTMAQPPVPGKATNPSPADQTTNVGLTVLLSWTPGSDTISHNVYFGTDSTPDSGEYQGNQTGNTFDPGALTGSTTYYWRIDEVNSQGTTTGDVWGFTTVSGMSAKMFEPVEWTFSNSTYSGNPFDLVATATFTHSTESDIVTELYYNGGTNWKLRFTGTATGTWSFTTSSTDSDLNGLSGSVSITSNPSVAGFATKYASGNRFGRTGLNEAFVPQYVKFPNLTALYNNPGYTDQYIADFFGEHGFNGVHTIAFCRWFDINKEYSTDILSMDPDPDPRTFEVLEDLILRVHEYGGVTHIWAWGDDQHNRTVTKWGINGTVDKRLQRYICARLGPLPGWSMGYGYDLQEWVVESDLSGWHTYMQNHLGWSHYLGARDAEMGQIYTGLDMSCYQEWRPSYSTYVTGIESTHSGKPTFFSDRFRIRTGSYYRDFKDYTEAMTRRGLWDSTMAGGAANIWGNESPIPPDNGGSHYYPNAKHLLTNGRFWRDRFNKDLVRDNALTNGVCLRKSNTSYVFYKESTSQITMNLTGMASSKKAVAVDCIADYEEIPLGTYTAANQTFNAPYSSDWAVSVGDADPPTSLEIDLGMVDEEDGIFRRINGDGDTIYTSIGGRECRRNELPGSDNFMYFSVIGTYSYQGSNPALYITIDYYDQDNGTIELHYDSPGSDLSDKYKRGGSVTVTGTNTWKQHTFQIGDAYFGNRQNAAADFRIFRTVGYNLYLDKVTVSDVPAGPPSQATYPNPSHQATGVALAADLSWTSGDGATSHDVYFGTDSTPDAGEFQGNQTANTFDPGTLTANTTYYWRIDEVNSSDTTTGTVWSFTTTTQSVTSSTLNVLEAGTITIDGNSGDWNLGEFTTLVRAGETVAGDVALVGYDAGTLYYSGYSTNLTLPASAMDHTARVYSRHDSTYQYFLVRCDDSAIQTASGTQGDNWKNDCVEFYIDPSHNGGSTAMSNSTSDIQLVIDAGNLQNVYMTTSSYKTQILNGVTSAVTQDGTGWWLEVRITKSALDPDLPANGTVGIDFNFRDNDNNNDSTMSTVYCWSDTEQSGAFPSKIPDRWGDTVLPTLAPPPSPGQATNPNPATSATGVDIYADLSWTAGSDATSHDVYFGTDSTPDSTEFQGNLAGTVFDAGIMDANTTYYWRVDEVNVTGTTTGTVWSFTTGNEVVAVPTLNVKAAGTITIDGSTSDWSLGDFTSKVRGDEIVVGDIALVGYDSSTLYYAGYSTNLTLPTSATDHTAKVYSRHNSTYQYFLVRCDDNDIETQNPTGTNWANDSVEFYIDPGNNAGASKMSDSTSDIQLVIDAANQQNVYMTTSTYKTQILNGVTSSVSTDANGWWLEVRITKSALDPDMPADGKFGIDFNFRDNDSNNTATLSTVYTWSDTEQSGSFPSKIPDRWGDAKQN